MFLQCRTVKDSAERATMVMKCLLVGGRSVKMDMRAQTATTLANCGPNQRDAIARRAVKPRTLSGILSPSR